MDGIINMLKRDVVYTNAIGPHLFRHLSRVVAWHLLSRQPSRSVLDVARTGRADFETSFQMDIHLGEQTLV